eukprot:13237-Heterococcus_DN1.PRE.4
MASTHVDPVTAVAAASGLEIDATNGGIAVNGLLEAVGGIYAAGACASYYDPALGRRRVDMLDHSINSLQQLIAVHCFRRLMRDKRSSAVVSAGALAKCCAHQLLLLLLLLVRKRGCIMSN